MNTKYISAIVKVGEAMKLVVAVKETHLTQSRKEILDLLNEACLKMAEPEKLTSETKVPDKK